MAFARFSTKSIPNAARRTAWVALFPLASACAPAPVGEDVVVVTIAPIAMMVREVAGEDAEVVTLVAPGASPHTHALRPSDMRARESSRNLFYISDGLDGWAARGGQANETGLLDALPKEFLLTGTVDKPDSDGADPHFWLDPLAVRSILPAVVDALASAKPEARAIYAANAARFALELQDLHKEIEDGLAGISHRDVVLFHPSFRYFFSRYDFEIAAVLEPFPGKEPSPRYVKEVIDLIAAKNVPAVFTEPQLPRRPAEALAEAARVPLYELDPIGGVPGRETYAELLRYNLRVLEEALR